MSNEVQQLYIMCAKQYGSEAAEYVLKTYLQTKREAKVLARNSSERTALMVARKRLSYREQNHWGYEAEKLIEDML